MCITVNIEDPNIPDVRDLLGAGIDLMHSLYPGKRKDGLSAAPPDVSDSRLLWRVVGKPHWDAAR